MSEENICPDTLSINGTEIHYEKKKYIQEDIVEKMLAEQREACADAVYRLTGDGEAMAECLNARGKNDE